MAQIDPSGRKSARTAIALAVIGVVALAVIYWQFLYSPLEEEVQRKRASHKKLDKENRDLKEEAKIQSAMLECQPELDALNRQNELMLPSESETVAFMKVLTNLAGTAGLAQGPTKKLAEAPVSAPPPPAAPREKKPKDGKKKGKGGKADKAADQAEAARAEAEAEAKDLPCWERVPGLKTDQAGKAGFVRVPFEIEVRGTFHQLTKYFWLIHEHAKTGRIITVENLALKDPKATADGVVVTASFVAVGFREADRPAGEGGAAGGAGGGKDIMGTKAAVREAAATREGQADVAGEGGAASSSTPPAAAPPAGSAPANPAQSGAQRLTNPGVAP